MSHRAVAPTLYWQSFWSREVFRYKYPQSGDGLIPNDFWYAVPAPSHRTVFPSPILQSTAFTCAVAVTVNPGTLASRLIGPQVFSDFSTHNHTGMFTSPICPTPGALFTTGSRNCIAATARYANVNGSVTTVSGSPGNHTHLVTKCRP